MSLSEKDKRLIIIGFIKLFLIGFLVKSSLEVILVIFIADIVLLILIDCIVLYGWFSEFGWIFERIKEFLDYIYYDGKFNININEKKWILLFIAPYVIEYALLFCYKIKEHINYHTMSLNYNMRHSLLIILVIFIILSIILRYRYSINKERFNSIENLEFENLKLSVKITNSIVWAVKTWDFIGLITIIGLAIIFCYNGENLSFINKYYILKCEYIGRYVNLVKIMIVVFGIYILLKFSGIIVMKLLIGFNQFNSTPNTITIEFLDERKIYFEKFELDFSKQISTVKEELLRLGFCSNSELILLKEYITNLENRNTAFDTTNMGTKNIILAVIVGTGIVQSIVSKTHIRYLILIVVLMFGYSLIGKSRQGEYIKKNNLMRLKSYIDIELASINIPYYKYILELSSIKLKELEKQDLTFYLDSVVIQSAYYIFKGRDTYKCVLSSKEIQEFYGEDDPDTTLNDCAKEFIDNIIPNLQNNIKLSLKNTLRVERSNLPRNFIENKLYEQYIRAVDKKATTMTNNFLEKYNLEKRLNQYMFNKTNNKIIKLYMRTDIMDRDLILFYWERRPNILNYIGQALTRYIIFNGGLYKNYMKNKYGIDNYHYINKKRYSLREINFLVGCIKSKGYMNFKMDIKKSFTKSDRLKHLILLELKNVHLELIFSEYKLNIVARETIDNILKYLSKHSCNQ